MKLKTLDGPVVVRSSVEPSKNYHDYLQYLRFDFYYSCAYCSMMEHEACGIRFEIDHYYPIKKHPELKSDYENLMYSCEKCNNFKSDFDPNQDQVSKGYVIIRPDRDGPEDHFEIGGVLLKGLTPTGEFNIDWLYLNRFQLRKLREFRKRLAEAREFIAFGLQSLASVRIDTIDPRKRYIFLQIKRSLEEKKMKINNSFNELADKLAKSELLDEDPEKELHRMRRKMYLSRQKAIGMDLLE